MPVKLFISKDPEDLQELPALCYQRGWELEAKSLITFEPVDFVVEKPFDLIFISSIRAFDHLISRYPEFRDSNFAVVGETTAAKMNVDNSRIKFLVENSGNVAESALKFKEFSKDKNILFPVSSISNNTYSNVVDADHKEVIIVYETIPSPAVIDKKGIYIFTSPSNVRSFFEANQIPAESTVIAWGHATESCLKEFNVNAAYSLKKSSEKELVELINKLF